jgi:PleD family two-component response regulator
MTPVIPVSVLIVDRSERWAPDLRERLARLGISVHVVTSPLKALRLCSGKKISVAVLEYGLDEWTHNLTAGLREKGVSIVYTSPSRDAALGARW